MKQNKDLISQAIEELMGQVNIGDVVAHPSNPIAFRLIDIVGNIGICEYPEGVIYKYPVCELFDCNKVKNRSIELKFEDSLFPSRNN